MNRPPDEETPGSRPGVEGKPGGNADSDHTPTGYPAQALRDGIVGEIHRAYASGSEHASKTLLWWLRIGDLLNEAKRGIAYGQWERWVDENLPFGPRQERKYRRLAEHRDKLAERNSNSVLTIDDAVALLADPKDCEPIQGQSPAQPAVIAAPLDVVAESTDAQPAGNAAPLDRTESTAPIPADFECVDDDAAVPVRVQRAPAPVDDEVARLTEEIKSLRSDYAEMTEQADELMEQVKSLEAVEGANDKVAAALGEAKKFRELNRILNERIRGMMNEKNEAIRAAKGWQRKYEKLARHERGS